MAARSDWARVRRHALKGRALLVALVAAALAPRFSVSQVGTAPPGAVTGTVWDSTSASPLQGADVYILGTSHKTFTTPEGGFRIDSVPAGDYTVVFFHPRLAQLGVSPGGAPARVVPGGETAVALTVPSVYTLLTAECALESAPGALSAGVPMVGRVTHQAEGEPIPDAGVVLTWPRVGTSPPGTVRLTSDEDGWFRSCSTPTGVPIGVLAEWGGLSSPRRELTLARGGPNRLDIRLSEHENATLTGRLLDGRSGTAVRGADVTLRGTDLVATTGGDGGFRIEEVPPGTYTVVVQHLPYAPWQDSLVLADGAVTDVVLRLSEEAFDIAPLEITVDRTNLKDRAMGGLVVGRDQIDKLQGRGVRDVADVLREQRVSGLIIRREGFGACVGFNSGQVRTHGRSGCVPVTVFIDGTRATDPYAIFVIPADAIDRMILYRPIEAGNLFGAGSANGVLEVYTKW